MIEGKDAFAWDEAAGNLRVTWDSEQPNGFFHLPLPTTLTDVDDFEMWFDVTLESLGVGFDSGSIYAYEVLSVGFINRGMAFSEEFRRTNASRSPNILEFDYFPDTGFKDTVAIVAVDSESRYANPSHNFPLTLATAVAHSVSIVYSAEDRTVRTTMTVAGEPFGTIKDVVLPTPDRFAGFSFDAFSISVYQDFTSWGWMTATGTIDNVRLLLPDPPELELEVASAGDSLMVRFEALAGWRFQVQRSEDLGEWTDVGHPVIGVGQPVELAGIRPNGEGFFRLRLNREQ